MDYFRATEGDSLRDDTAGDLIADRQVHHGNASGDSKEGTASFPTGSTLHRQPLRKSSLCKQESNGDAGSDGSAARHPPRKGVSSQPKRSMTLPDERLMFPDASLPANDITGLGIGLISQSKRILKGSPRGTESSASSDDEPSVPGPQPSIGPNLSFSQKRALSSASPGFSKYPAMLFISDSGVSPKTSPRRRMTSGNSSPDPDHLGTKSSLPRTGSPGRSGPSSLRSPTVASTSRLQALVDDSLRAGRDRRLSQSGLSVSSADPRSARRRRTTTNIVTTPADGGHHMIIASPVSSTFEAGGSGTTTPTSIHPASGPKRNSSLSYGPPLERSETPSQDGKDSLSSAREANDDESMNEERADVADTVKRKREQSVDPNHAPRRRLTYTDGAEDVSGGTETRSRKPENASTNEKGKQRAPLAEMGFEGSLGGPFKGNRPSTSTANATLDSLLASIDIANAMRLIQKQTALPAGVTDQEVPSSAQSTVRSPRKHAERSPEVFVPRAPPPILHDHGTQEHHSESTERRLSHGHVAFVQSIGELTSSEDTQSFQMPPEAARYREHRLSASSSSPSGFLCSKRYVSSPSLNSNGHTGGINSGGINSGTPQFAKATASPEAKHKRSISERFSLSHHLMSHGKKSKHKEGHVLPETVDEVALEVRDLADFQERIQSSLLELSHHPRAEKLAYQARSYMQAYYSLVFESIRSPANDHSPVPLHPLAVIRWRKDVLREEAKRKAYEAARTSKRTLPPGQGDARRDNSVLSLNSPPQASPQISRPPSKPLHSVEMLLRAEEADSEKHMKKSTALREWMVTPGEMIAYLNCKGIVDHFIAPAHNGTSLWGEIPMMDRSPSTLSASSTPSRSVVSPSRNGHTKSPMTNASQFSAGTDWASDAEIRRGSVDHGERLSSAIRSPLRSIRRHIHAQHEREGEGRGSFTSDTENETGKSRRHGLMSTAQRFKIRSQVSKEDVQQIEDSPSVQRGSVAASEGKLSIDIDDRAGGELATPQERLRSQKLETSRSPNVRSDEYDQLPVEEADEAYGQRLHAIQSVEAALSRTPDLERHSESVVNEFISMVEEFRMRGRCSTIQDDLELAKRLQFDFAQQKQVHLHEAGTAPAMQKAVLRKTSSGGRHGKGFAAAYSVSFDPLNALKDIIGDLHGRYDTAVRQAIEVCRKQDAVQRQASEILPEAEHLLSEVGDRVRKLRAIRESFYTLDAIQSNHNPAYYHVVDVGLMVVGFVVRTSLLLGRYGFIGLGYFISFGSWIASFMRARIVNVGSTLMSLAFWIALFAGIWIGAVCL